MAVAGGYGVRPPPPPRRPSDGREEFERSERRDAFATPWFGAGDDADGGGASVLPALAARAPVHAAPSPAAITASPPVSSSTGRSAAPLETEAARVAPVAPHHQRPRRCRRPADDRVLAVCRPT